MKTVPQKHLPVFFMLLAIFATTGRAEADSIVGPATVTDGDTIVINDTPIRLDGIDAPETDQTCIGGDRRAFPCGVQARDALRDMIADRRVTCAGEEIDQYDRRLMVCSTAGRELNAAMVAEGWALAFVRYSNRYLTQQERAQARRTGMWAGAFIAPWDWRRRGEDTVVLGTTEVPVDAQALLLPPQFATQSASTGCEIKGNINRGGDRIYHVPGMHDYERTRINERNGERWFCTEAEAQAAGWRRAER